MYDLLSSWPSNLWTAISIGSENDVRIRLLIEGNSCRSDQHTVISADSENKSLDGTLHESFKKKKTEVFSYSN